MKIKKPSKFDTRVWPPNGSKSKYSYSIIRAYGYEQTAMKATILSFLRKLSSLASLATLRALLSFSPNDLLTTTDLSSTLCLPVDALTRNYRNQFALCPQYPESVIQHHQSPIAPKNREAISVVLLYSRALTSL